MSVESFNVLEEPAAMDLLSGCLAVRRWQREVADARPYADWSGLFVHAKASAENLTDEELAEALAAHPRIGERSSGADMASAEQAGVDDADAELTGRLQAGNRAYEDRFGRVFLIRAAGRDGTEILTELERRLGNDPETERRETVAQLREIALLRLEDAVTSLRSTVAG